MVSGNRRGTRTRRRLRAGGESSGNDDDGSSSTSSGNKGRSLLKPAIGLVGCLAVAASTLGQMQASRRNLRSLMSRVMTDYGYDGGGEDGRGGKNSSTTTRRRSRRKRRRITIEELVDTDPEEICPEGLLRVSDVRDVSTTSNHSVGITNQTGRVGATLPERAIRKIPRTVHVTSRSRCVPQPFADNLALWKFPDHKFFFHNDGAMDRLLYGREWPEFPHLPMAARCHKSGAGKADLWRALVLWEYGGVYTDIDNAPNQFDGATLASRDEAFFVIEGGAFLSQYFMAAEPRHPLMYLLVQQTLLRLLNLNEVDQQYVPYVTGPGALKNAFIHFMRDQGPNEPRNAQYQPKYGKVRQPGVYTGIRNKTVTVAGTARNPSQYVKRNVIPQKHKLYQQYMNMTHFSRQNRGAGGNSTENEEDDETIRHESCLQRIFRTDPELFHSVFEQADDDYDRDGGHANDEDDGYEDDYVASGDGEAIMRL